MMHENPAHLPTKLLDNATKSDKTFFRTKANNNERSNDTKKNN